MCFILDLIDVHRKFDTPGIEELRKNCTDIFFSPENCFNKFCLGSLTARAYNLILIVFSIEIPSAT